ncbi:hypothetical protein [Calidifontibacillus erzurumensis]
MVEMNSIIRSLLQNDIFVKSQTLYEKDGKSAANSFDTKRSTDLLSLLKTLELPDNAKNRHLLALLLKERISLSKEMLKSVSQWISQNEQNSLPAAFQLIRLALERDLPITKSVLNVLSAALDTETTMIEQLKIVTEVLREVPEHTKIFNDLKLIEENIETSIAKLLKNNSENENFWNNSKEIAIAIKKLVQKIGIHHEENEQSLRSLLTKVLQETKNGQVVKKIEPLLQRIIGLKLLNFEQEGLLQTYLWHFPLLLNDHGTDFILQWTAKKQKNGQIDPNYCRLIFFLELEMLKELFVDCKIQNRIVNIQIYNDSIEHSTLKAFHLVLKERLALLKYQLTDIAVLPFEKKGTPKENHKNKIMPFSQIEQKSGVDLKI